MEDDTERKAAAEISVLQLEELLQTLREEVEKENCDVHDERLGKFQWPAHDKTPRSIYFYYMKFDWANGLEVRQYFYPKGKPEDENNPPSRDDWDEIPNDEESLKPIIKKLIENARSNGTNYYKIADGFDDIKWQRRSYIVFVMDNDKWKLHKIKESKQPALAFITSRKKDVKGTPNHSFFDGQDLDIKMDGGTTCSAFVCINHMKLDKAGTPLSHFDKQLFHFLLYFNVTFAAGSPITIIFDPDGNNLGPPLPPP